MPYLANLKQRARALKFDTLALYFAARHPATPWYAKLMAFLVVAYAFSPIDLVPDFVPVLGYLDDVILIPLGITLTLRLIPDAVMLECRERAAGVLKKPVNWLAGAVIVLIWVSLAALSGWWLYRWLET
jgi:uncharacterized membrane protein YkvA (DUF1232 family)